MTDNQRAMYTGICICRNTEVAQRWTRTTLFFLIHSAALSFVVSRPQLTPRLFFWMSIVGLVLTGIWFLANWRTDQWIVYWQPRLAALEQTEAREGETGVFAGPDWEQINAVLFTFNVIVNSLIGFITILWFVILVWGFFL